MNGALSPGASASPLVRIAVSTTPLSAFVYVAPLSVTWLAPAGIVPVSVPPKGPFPVLRLRLTSVAAVTVPITVITLVSSYALTNNLAAAQTVSRSAAELNQVINGTFRSSLLLLGVVLVLQFIQVVIINSVLTYLASERHLGRSVTIGEAFSAVKSRFLSVAGFRARAFA